MTTKYGIINPQNHADILLLTNDFGFVITMVQAGLEYREIEPCSHCAGTGKQFKPEEENDHE